MPDDPDHPTSVPARRARLVAVKPSVRKVVRLWNVQKLDLEQQSREHEHLSPRHQVGGEPYLMQGADSVGGACPGCRESMPLLASASDDAGSGTSFIGNRGVQVVFLYCARCQVVSAGNQCD